MKKKKLKVIKHQVMDVLPPGACPVHNMQKCQMSPAGGVDKKKIWTI